MPRSKSSSSSSDKSELEEFFRKIEEKIEEKFDAPALNGGFTELCEKVDSIQEGLIKLNTAVFDHENGLFVQVKKESVEVDHDFESFEKRMTEIEERFKFYRKMMISIAAAIGMGILTGIGKLIWMLLSHVQLH